MTNVCAVDELSCVSTNGIKNAASVPPADTVLTVSATLFAAEKTLVKISVFAC